MHVLAVDDDPAMLRYLQTLLEAGGHRVETAADGPQAITRLQKGAAPELVLLDMLMPEMNGVQTLTAMRRIDPRVKVVMLSSVNHTRTVAEAMRCGAYDYLAKPFEITELDAVLAECSRATGGGGERGEETLEDLGDGVCFLAADEAMKQIRRQAHLVANVDVPVLILGESGVGKEVVARMIHHHSKRAHRPFLKVNCAAVPSELLESELFGYEAGAFTGATRSKPGKFELCGNGTILLDEIGEMSPALQAKLLHVLQDGTFSRLGGRSTIKADVRILAATNVNVREAIAARMLREDLYYRLSAFVLKVPPLRERRNEVPLLMRRYMGRLAQEFGRPPLPLSPELLEIAQRYPWPGNVRELINVIKRLLVLGDESLVTAELKAYLPKPPVSVTSSASPGGIKSLVRSLKDEAEMAAIADALRETRGNRKEAARLLQLSYKALLYKMRQFGISPENPGRSMQAKLMAVALLLMLSPFGARSLLQHPANLAGFRSARAVRIARRARTAGTGLVAEFG
jgi:two-component system response regulator AtoC